MSGRISDDCLAFADRIRSESAGSQISHCGSDNDLIKILIGHWRLIDHLESTCSGSGKENIPRSIAHSSNLTQNIDLQ
jgi:hypothetical protein